jgi:hypothetical protein
MTNRVSVSGALEKVRGQGIRERSGCQGFSSAAKGLL